MTINYTYEDNGFDYSYSTDIEELVKATNIILNEKDKEELIEIIKCSDGCVLDLSEFIKEDLCNYFRDKAYKEYIEWRYE